MRCTLQVNSQLQTSNPDVYAVGDIAAFPLTLYGDQINRQEHVANARWAGCPLVVLHLEAGLGSKVCKNSRLNTQPSAHASTFCRTDKPLPALQDVCPARSQGHFWLQGHV